MPAYFLLRYLRSPLLVGSLIPSSPALARVMSAHAQGYGNILELGAGTGPITRQLSQDHGQAVLNVFELDSAMALGLADAHPRAKVWDGCLHERADVVLSQPARCVAVSALPFRSLPSAVLVPTLKLITEFLTAHSHRKLVQFTYGLREPFENADSSLVWKRQARVWMNFPPASVWTLQRANDKDS